MKIYLDFFSGSHGHFLEYVINTWLFNGPRVKNIFNDLGASHLIRSDLKYMSDRVVTAKHYSEFNIATDTPDQVVRISISDDYAKWIYQINIIERAGDIPAEKKNKKIPDTIKNIPHAFRNNWYSKFNFEENGYVRPGNWRWQEIPAFDFPLESLFDATEFYCVLYKLSSFLNTTFVPDHELAQLLESFLLKNQGWQFYLKCKNIVHESLLGNNIEFDSSVCEQALINTMLTQTVGVFDGELFDSDTYPGNTLQLWNQIYHHLKTFDQRF
jgi:hypothetical protein